MRLCQPKELFYFQFNSQKGIDRLKNKRDFIEPDSNIKKTT